MENLVFISHANPEDNEFARWLGLQLNREGYAIWSDVTKLIGGESFWSDIEDAIRNYTIKFIFVLSRFSNDPKRGSIDELHLAKSIAKIKGKHDFIIPVRIDDLPINERNIAIEQSNVIDFTQSWAQGLDRLLEKLQKDDITRNLITSNPSAVSSWWRTNYEGSGIIRREPETHVSNWFPILNLPTTIYIHSFNQPIPQRDRIRYLFPAHAIGQSIVSFAEKEALEFSDAETSVFSTNDFIESPNLEARITPRDRKNIVSRLLQMAWLYYIETTPLPLFQLANERKCAYFTPDMFVSKFQSFEIQDLISGKRSLVGQVKGKTWHFALSADFQFEPILAYVVRPHVLFSDDGKNIWNVPSKLHKARRSACKNWWNDRWRDLILTSLSYLSQKHDAIDILLPLGKNVVLPVSTKPITFECPVSYIETDLVENPFLDESTFDDIEIIDVEEEL